MVRDYWRRVVVRAWEQTIRSLGFESRGRIVTAIFSFVVTVAVLLFWGSQDAAGDMTLERGALWVITLLAFPFIYLWIFLRVSPEWDKQKTDRISELEGQLQPAIELKTTEKSVWFSEDAASLSVAVTNLSDSTIHNVFVELDRFVDSMPIVNLPRKLKPRDEPGPKFDLAPRRTQYVVFGTAYFGDDARVEYEFIDKQANDYSRVGKYKVKLKAYGDDIQPVNCLFPLVIFANKRSFQFGSAGVHDAKKN